MPELRSFTSPYVAVAVNNHYDYDNELPDAIAST